MGLGKATVNITANLKPLKEGLARAKSAVSSSVTRISRDIKKIGKVARGVQKSLKFAVKFSGVGFVLGGLKKIINLSKLATAAILGIGIASVKIATDIEETENLFRISMGSMAEEAEAFAKDYSRSLGLFENDTKKALGTFQLMLTSMGIAEKESFQMSKQLVTLANDIASFRNQRPADVFLKLQAGITGEAEPLKRLGILVNDAIIKQLALEKGLLKVDKARKKTIKTQVNGSIKATQATKKNTRALTDAEKVTLRYDAIVKATTKDQGDMSRTLDDTANVFRAVISQIKRTGGTIGKELLPQVTKAGIGIRDALKNNQDKFETWAKKSAGAIGLVIGKFKQYIDFAKTGDFKLIFEDLGKIFGDLAKETVGLFKKINPIAVELGKKIGEGFFESVKDTKLGEILRAPAEIKARVQAPATAIGSFFAGRQEDVRGQQIRATKREIEASGEVATSKAILAAIEKQNRILSNEGRRGRDF